MPLRSLTLLLLMLLLSAFRHFFDFLYALDQSIPNCGEEIEIRTFFRSPLNVPKEKNSINISQTFLQIFSEKVV